MWGLIFIAYDYIKVVCDDNMMLLDAFMGWPGSVHDSPQAAQALSMNHTSNTIIKGLYGIFYKISMEVVKSENSQ